MNILITNDDSHRSPLLSLAVDYFSKLGTVHLVVPTHEQSWTGKSMSRFDPVHVQKASICGHEALSVNGTPADCVNMAVYNLLSVKPDLVVSGINAGFNMGIGFILSSGTVGACLEANLAGIPAIALSQALSTDVRVKYCVDYMIEDQVLSRFRSQTVSILDGFTDKVLGADNRDLFLSTPVTWNINFPFEQTPGTRLTAAHIGKNRYTRCFNETTAGQIGPVKVYQHTTINETMDTNPKSDASLLLGGCATVSVMDIWSFGGGGDTPSIVNPLWHSFV